MGAAAYEARAYLQSLERLASLWDPIDLLRCGVGLCRAWRLACVHVLNHGCRGAMDHGDQRRATATAHKADEQMQYELAKEPRLEPCGFTTLRTPSRNENRKQVSDAVVLGYWKQTFITQLAPHYWLRAPQTIGSNAARLSKAQLPCESLLSIAVANEQQQSDSEMHNADYEGLRAQSKVTFVIIKARLLVCICTISFK